MDGDPRTFENSGVLILRSLLAERLTAPEFGRFQSGHAVGEKVINDWRRREAVRLLACDPVILTTLQKLYGRRPFPFQTLNFSRGSEQRLHADSIHFDSLPSGYMCGVWIALEDVAMHQGPLTYVPGSHLLPQLDPSEAHDTNGRFDYELYEDLIATQVAGMEVRKFTAKAGDVLIWDANLVHGGDALTDRSSTRRSQVTHYFFDNCSYVTPMDSRPQDQRFRMRDPLIDISTGSRVRHRIAERDARIIRHRDGTASLLPGSGQALSLRTRASSALWASVSSVRWRGGLARDRIQRRYLRRH